MDPANSHIKTGDLPKKQSLLARLNQGRKKIMASRHTKSGKKLFWAWIAYQSVKGTITTSLIWVPMIYYYFSH